MICSLENDMRNNLSTPSSENFHFDWFLLCKVFNILPKNVDTSYLSWHWRLMQNLKKKWFAVCKNDINLANFHQSIWKSQNWDFVGIVLSKVENVLD